MLPFFLQKHYTSFRCKCRSIKIDKLDANKRLLFSYVKNIDSIESPYRKYYDTLIKSVLYKSKATEHLLFWTVQMKTARCSIQEKPLPLRSVIKHSNFYQLAECYRNVARSRQWFRTETVDIAQSESSQCRRKLRNGWSLTITAPSRKKRICY